MCTVHAGDGERDLHLAYLESLEAHGEPIPPSINEEVIAKDERARGFYVRYGFEPSPTNPLHLVVLMKDVRVSISAG